MNIISLNHISKVFHERPIFEDASFFLQEGEKVGVVGINGTGKSTLLRMILGVEEADAGERVLANHLVCAYLPQRPELEEGCTVLEAVLAKIGGEDGFFADRETTLNQAKQNLLALGIDCFEAKVDTLSGGQKKRVALAAIVMCPADVLLLDEPTNHLDYEMVEWLESFLKNTKKSFVMVTHDRYFLDSVCNCIAEVDRGLIYRYDTNYEGYLTLKAERMEMREAAQRKRKSILTNELKWIRRGAQARTTKQKARIERFQDMVADQQNDRRLDAIHGPGAMDADNSIGLSSASRMGKTTVELTNISKAYGEQVLIRDFSYIFLKNDRVAFVGKNGCGKTTLMKMIAGLEQPDFGEIKIGQTIKIGYYAQMLSEDPAEGLAYMDPNLRVIDYIRNTAEFVRTRDGLVSASVMLDNFLFPPSAQYGLIGKLSGGERRRLNLLRVLMESPNVLILDEPTNDLDIRTLTILEDYLDSYEGIVITVTHDRYFCDRTMNRIFAFDEDGSGVLTQYEGGYTDYREKCPRKDVKQEEVPKAEDRQKKVYVAQHEKKLKFTFQEQKEYDIIEDVIASLEDKLTQIDAQIERFSMDFIKLGELGKEKEETQALLDEKMERWMYLQDLAEQIEAQKK